MLDHLRRGPRVMRHEAVGGPFYGAGAIRRGSTTNPPRPQLNSPIQVPGGRAEQVRCVRGDESDVATPTCV
jgi:hypothetical protein